MVHVLCLAALLSPTPEFRVNVVDTKGKPQSGILVQIATDNHFRNIIEQGKTDKKGTFRSARFFDAPIRKDGEDAGLRVAVIKAVVSATIETGQQVFRWSPTAEFPDKPYTSFTLYPGGRRADVHRALRRDTVLVFTEVRRWDPAVKKFVSTWEGTMEYSKRLTVHSCSRDGGTKFRSITIKEPYDPSDWTAGAHALQGCDWTPCPCSYSPCWNHQ